MAEEGTASLSGSDNTDTNTNGRKFVVGEHSVYDSVEALFEGAKQKEKYIAELIKANKELQEKYDSVEKNNSLLDELREFRKQVQEGGYEPMDSTNPSVDYDVMKEIALKAMQEKAAADAADNNLKDCLDSIGHTSEEADLAIKSKASELGVSVEYLKDIAMSSPKAFKSMFGIKQTETASPNFLQSTKQIENDSRDEASEFFKNKQLSNSPRAIAAFFEKAVRNPSILDNVKW